jgi:Ca2+-binding EF-hand superfamily protein
VPLTRRIDNSERNKLFDKIAKEFARRQIHPQEFFYKFDRINTGTLETESFKHAMKKICKDITPDQIDVVIEDVRFSD